MFRTANVHEKKLFEIIKDLNGVFYYDSIFQVVSEENFVIRIEKEKEEMIGYATVTMEDQQRIDYEVRYNRIVNLNEGYTLLVAGMKAG